MSSRPRHRFRRGRRQGAKWLAIATLGTLGTLASVIPIRLAIAARQAPRPQAILTLGGGTGREYTSAVLSRSYPHLDVWVSSGSLPDDATAIFTTVGASTHRLNLDYSATDTVTNFTTILPQLKRRRIQHVYLVTSDYHMRRAQTIATIILGSHGITFTPVPVTTQQPDESLNRVIRDAGRSIFWVFTGKSGYQLKSESCEGKNRLEAIVELLVEEGIQCQAL